MLEVMLTSSSSTSVVHVVGSVKICAGETWAGMIAPVSVQEPAHFMF